MISEIRESGRHVTHPLVLTHTKLPVYLCSKLVHTSGAPTFATWYPRHRLPDYLALTANGVHIHKSHRTVAKKEEVLTGHRKTPLPATIYLGLVQREQAKHPNPSIPLERD